MEDKQWAEEIWKRLVTKIGKVAVRNRDKLPGICIDGQYDDRYQVNITSWTNGFWGGLMWILYAGTGDECFKKTAERSEQLLDEAFLEYDALHHDVGFMWHITAGADYRLTGNKKSYLRNIYAANILAGRYKMKGGYIRAWNKEEQKGYSIIDTMMNLAQLYWASEVTGDSRYKDIAMVHADMTALCHVRPDGSVYHIVDHDPETGEVLGYPIGQGMSETSSWSRGQAWSVYGFVISYIHTGKVEYLEIAKRVAHYFIAAVCDDYLPQCDFRSPKEPLYYDSTAGAIAASGLLEISRQVPEYEQDMYRRAAMRLLRSMEENLCDWDENTDAVLLMGTEAYGEGARKNIPIIYGDFFFAEAIYKCIGGDVLFW